MSIEYAHILPRRGTAATWTSVNPVLMLGEEGLETDTLRKKLGDGVTTWNALAYLLDAASASSTYGPLVDPRRAPLKAWHAALAGRDTATATAVIIGDSLTEGGGTTGGQANNYVTRLQSRLRTLLPSDVLGSGGGFGYIPACNSDQVSFVPAATIAGPTAAAHRDLAANYGLGKLYVALFTPTDILTFPSQVCTGFDLFFVGAPAQPSVTYTVDGGAPITVVTTATGNPTPGMVLAVRGLAAAAHIIAVQGPPTTTFPVNIEGVRFYNGDEAAGIQILNGGHSGAVTYTFNTAPAWMWQQPLLTSNATLVCIATGTNDVTIEGSAAYQSDLNNLITGILGTYSFIAKPPPSLAIISAYQRTNGALTEPWANYVAAAKSAAAANGALHIDLGLSMPPASDVALGLYSADGIHPNRKGHRSIADVLAAQFAPV